MKIIQLANNDIENIKKAEKTLLKNEIQCSVEELEHLVEMGKLIEEKKLEFKVVQLEEQISELDKLYQQLTKRVRGFIKMDVSTGKLSIVDKFLEELSGYPIEKWQNKPNFIEKIIHPDFEDYYAARIAEMKKGIVPKLMEYKIIRKNGEERWWLQFNIGAYDIYGKLISISAVIVDNDEQKKTEIKYRNLFENLNAGVFRVNIDTGKFLDVNQKLANYVGYATAEEFKEKCNAKQFYYNIEDRNRIIHLLKTKGKVTDYEVKLQTEDGNYFWVTHSASYYPKEGFCEGILIDITARKNAEKKIKEKEEKIRQERNLAQSYFDMAGALLLVLDKEANIVQINRKGCEILGYSQEEIVGKNWIETCLPSRIHSAVQRTFNKCVNGELKREECFENYVLTKDNEERLISWHNTVLRDSGDNVTAVISSGEDITLPQSVEKIIGDNEIINDSEKEHTQI